MDRSKTQHTVSHGAPLAADARVLVTGGTGFIGSHLVDALVALGVRPRVLVRPSSDTSGFPTDNVELIPGTLEDSGSLARAVSGVDTVFHVAAATKARSEAAYRCVNATGTERLVEALRTNQPDPAHPRRLVYLSSLAAAGPAADGQPVEPRHVPHPLTAYGRSKLAGERACLAASDGALRVVALRAPVVYGPREKDFFLLFKLAARGILLAPTGPERVVQFVHVDDLVRALLRAATAPAARGVYHVAEARSYTWSEVAAALAQAVGRSVRLIPIPRPVLRMAAALSECGAAVRGRATIFTREKVTELLAPNWLCETALARRELGFTARIPMRSGFAETATWYKQQTWL